ncbi:MAG: hypothetical protein OEZ43_11280 [Gammaproteobacteria bacterium]|nr:hypothetical protein [Gammaproteobacteria bacterium]
MNAILRHITLWVAIVIGVLSACGERFPEYVTTGNTGLLSARASVNWSVPTQIDSQSFATGVDVQAQGPIVASTIDRDIVAWNLRTSTSRTQAFQVDPISSAISTTSFLPPEHVGVVTELEFFSDSLTNTTYAAWQVQGQWYFKSDIQSSNVPWELGEATNLWYVSDTLFWTRPSPTGIDIVIEQRGRKRTVINRPDVIQSVFSEPAAISNTSAMLVWFERSSAGTERVLSLTVNEQSQPVPTDIQTIKGMLASSDQVVAVKAQISVPLALADVFIQMRHPQNGDSVLHVSQFLGQWMVLKYVDGLAPVAGRFIRDEIEIGGMYYSPVIAYVEEKVQGDTSRISVNSISREKGAWLGPVTHGSPVLRRLNDPLDKTAITRLYAAKSTHYAITWVESTNTANSLNMVLNSTLGGWLPAEAVVSLGSGQEIEDYAFIFRQDRSPWIYWTQTSTQNNVREYSLWRSSSLQAIQYVFNPVTSIVVTPDITQPASHIPTSDNCLACHQADRSILVDHNEVRGNCFTCHDGVSASAKPETHIPTTNSCESCHSTIMWIAGVAIDHWEILGPCVICHNGIYAAGQPSFHFPTSYACEACHDHRSWTPVSNVDHTQVFGDCFSCHNNIVAPGQTDTHLPTTNSCDACHNTIQWSPAVTNDHNEYLWACPVCHNGVIAPGKNMSHILASDNCTACHSSVAWVPYLVVDHTQVIGTCSGCHKSSTLAITVLPESHFGYTEECDACHTTQAWLPLIDTTPPLVAPTHIANTGRCEACHTINAWVPAIRVDHQEVVGTCFSCHNGVTATGKSPTHIFSSTVCENCHAPGAWAIIAGN